MMQIVLGEAERAMVVRRLAKAMFLKEQGERRGVSLYWLGHNHGEYCGILRGLEAIGVDEASIRQAVDEAQERFEQLVEDLLDGDDEAKELI